MNGRAAAWPARAGRQEGELRNEARPNSAGGGWSGSPRYDEGLGRHGDRTLHARNTGRDGMVPPAMEPTVRDVPEADRFEIRDGERVLGVAAYQRRGDTVVFTHTEVDPDAGQSGLGSTLVRAALDDVRARGGSVVPRCPFVRGWIDRHPEYADLVVRTDA